MSLSSTFRLYLCELLIRLIIMIVPRQIGSGRMLLICLVSYLSSQLRGVDSKDQSFVLMPFSSPFVAPDVWQDVNDRTYGGQVVPGTSNREQGNWRGW